MNNVSGHIAILAAAGVAAAALAFATYLGRRMETAASAHAPVVVTLPQRPSAPAAQPAPPQPPPAAAARDPVSLARQLQSELKRVGCYDGEISGAWTPRTRMAMKAFTDRVNATLPVDKPDLILLALVQSHRGVACSEPVLARAPAKPEQPETDAAQKPLPAVVPPIVAVAPRLQPSSNSAAPPSAKAERAPQVPAARSEPAPGSAQAPSPPGSPAERPLRTARHGGPVPEVGIYERRTRRSVRPYRQVRYARALIRSLKRAALPPWRLP